MKFSPINRLGKLKNPLPFSIKKKSKGNATQEKVDSAQKNSLERKESSRPETLILPSRHIPPFKEPYREGEDKSTYFTRLQAYINHLTDQHPQETHAALEEILGKGSLGDSIEELETFQPVTIGDWLQHPGNSALRSKLLSCYDRASSLIKKPENTQRPVKAQLQTAIQVQLRMLIAARAERFTQTMKHTSSLREGISTEPSRQFDQSFHRFEHSAPFVRSVQQALLHKSPPPLTKEELSLFDNEAVPSALDKGDIPSHLYAPANLGVVTDSWKQKGTKKSEVVLIRHGQLAGPTSSTMDPNQKREVAMTRTLKVLAFAAMQQHQASAFSGKGFSRGKSSGEKETYHFQHSILTHLDGSRLKAWVDTQKGGENEREKLLAFVDAIDHWPEGGFPMEIDGKMVFLMRPLVSQEVASAITKMRRKTGKRTSHRLNWLDNQQRYEWLIEKANGGILHPNSKDPTLLGLKKQFGLSHRTSLLNHEDFWKSRELKNYEKAQKKLLKTLYQYQAPRSEECKKALESMYGIMFRRSIQDDSKLRTSDLLDAYTFVHEYLGISDSRSCLAGSERTGQNVAGALALRMRPNRKFSPFLAHKFLGHPLKKGDCNERSIFDERRIDREEIMRTFCKPPTVMWKSYQDGGDGLNFATGFFQNTLFSQGDYLNPHKHFDEKKQSPTPQAERGFLGASQLPHYKRHRKLWKELDQKALEEISDSIGPLFPDPSPSPLFIGEQLRPNLATLDSTKLLILRSHLQSLRENPSTESRRTPFHAARLLLLLERFYPSITKEGMKIRSRAEGEW